MPSMISSQDTAGRQTKYCFAVEEELAKIGHATNSELLTLLQRKFPDVSATTVHRVTARLASRGKIALAPQAKDGSLRYDSNLKPHDHFMCSNCGKIMDTDVKAKVVPILESAINGCNIAGRLTITGLCKDCIKGGNDENNDL